MVKKYSWKGCSNLIMPIVPTSLLNVKRKILSKSYRGFGRPRNSDYEYKSALDLIFEMDVIYNKKVDSLMK